MDAPLNTLPIPPAVEEIRGQRGAIEVELLILERRKRILRFVLMGWLAAVVVVVFFFYLFSATPSLFLFFTGLIVTSVLFPGFLDSYGMPLGAVMVGFFSVAVIGVTVAIGQTMAMPGVCAALVFGWVFATVCLKKDLCDASIEKLRRTTH